MQQPPQRTVAPQPPIRLAGRGAAQPPRFELRGTPSPHSGNSANASPAPSPGTLAIGASPFALAFGGGSSYNTQQPQTQQPTAASRRRNSAAAQAVALSVSASEHARLKKQLDMRSGELQLLVGGGADPSASPRGGPLLSGVRSAARLGAATPSFYAATNTFAGEDALHSSNASFNQQLRKVQEKLREQTREQRNSAAAAAILQQQQQQQQFQQQQQPEESYTARMLQRDRADFHAPFHTRSSPIPQYFSAASAQASAAAGLSTQAHPAAHSSSSSSFLPPPFPVSARSQPQQPQQQPQQHQPRHPSQPTVAAPHVRPHAVPRRHHDWRSHSSATSSEDSGDSSDDAGPVGAQRMHVIGGSAEARTRSLHVAVAGLQVSSQQPTQPNQTLSRSRSAFDASLAAASSSLAGPPAPSHSPILPLPRQRNSASSPVPRPIAPTLQPPPLPLAQRAPLWPLVPQTGTHFPMALARPQHLAVVPTYLEALANNCTERDRAALVRRLRAADEAKASRQQLVGCTVVYDSIDPNPEHQAPSPPPPPLIVGNGPLDLTSAAMAGASPAPALAAPPRLSAAALAAWRAPAGELTSYYIPSSPSDSTLVFESRFESGNLRRAIQVRPFEYDLLVRPDVNTEKYAQWFYFAVKNTRSFTQSQPLQPQQQQGQSSFGPSSSSPTPAQPQNVIYKFNLVNLQKSDSLYNAGMQICMYSRRKSAASAQQGKHLPYTHFPYHCGSNVAGAQDGHDPDEVSFLPPSAPGAVGWYRGGFDIAWYKSSKRAYTLSFSWTAEFDADTIYFAMAVPYTLTQLYRELDAFGADARRDCMVRQRVLCRTLAGNDVPLVLITDFTASAAEIAARPAVVISARVHPGESNASWMMKGIMEFLLSVPSSAGSAGAGHLRASSGGPPDLSQHSAHASLLRSRFVFYLIPCLNPDGVVNGNYRCSLAGVDLNRTWMLPDPAMHPTIWATKMLLARLQGKAAPVTSAAPAAGFVLGDEQKTPASSPPLEEDPLMSPREVVMFADLHGHSRAPNVFLYGVAASAAEEAQQPPTASPAASPRSSPSLSPAASPSPLPPSSSPLRKSFPAHRLFERVFPRLLSLRSPFFDWDSSHFAVRKSKETTARVVVARELGIANSFTIEASFGGVISTPPPPTESSNAPAASPSPSASLSRGAMSSSSPSLCPSPSVSPSPAPAAPTSFVNPLHNSRYQGFQFSTRMYEEMGWNICAALVDYANPDLYAQTRQELEAMYPAKATVAGSESAAVNGLAEDSDDDEVDPSVAAAAAEIEASLRSKLRGPRKKKKKVRASTASRVGDSKDRPESKEAPGSGGGKKKRRARSKSGERKRRPSDAESAAVSASSTARAHSASLLPAALHVKRLLDRMEAESAAAAATSSGVVGSDGDLSEADLSDTGVQPSASAPDLFEALLTQPRSGASVPLVKSASRVRMAPAPASFDSASYVSPSSLLLAELPLVAGSKPRRPSAKKKLVVKLKKKKLKAASSSAATGSSKAS